MRDRVKIVQFKKPKLYGPEKCPIYFHLLWIGKFNPRFTRHIIQNMQFCYFSANPQPIFTSQLILKSIYVFFTTPIIIITNVSVMLNILIELIRLWRLGLVITCQLRFVKSSEKICIHFIILLVLI